MVINYKDIKKFNEEQLYNLFHSVGWESAKYPDKLVKVMANSDSVVSAWDGELLIGLMTAMTDGLNVYYHYLLVNPDYQKMGVGRELVNMMKNRYKDCFRQILITMGEDLVNFYSKHGFEGQNEKVPMFLNNHNI